MRLRPTFCALAALLASAFSLRGQAPGRVVLVLPFDNRSGNASLGWIGDSFPDTLDKRLNSSGFLTISRDDRVFALDHLGLPTDFKPSRATTLRIAQQLDADFVVVGSYNIADNRIAVQAQVLTVDALRLSPPIEDSAELPRLFDAENAIAWKVARVLDPAFSVAEPTFLAAPGGVPLPAFEDYIRGISAPTAAERLRRLQAAVTTTPAYAAALLALGKEQFAAHDYAAAAATLARVPAANPLSLEAGFYLGLAHFNSAEYGPAEAAFGAVANRLPLSEVVNDEGVAAARQNHDAVELFRRASTTDPNDEDYHYNLALALFRRGDLAAAKSEADAALRLKPADQEAVDLRARLNLAQPGQRLAAPGTANAFSPVERIRRTYSETGFRQAAFELDQMRTLRLATLPPAQQAVEYTQLGNDYLMQGLLPEADRQFSSALAADSSSAGAHAGLAQVRLLSNDPDGARSEAIASLQAHKSAAAYIVLARLDFAQKLRSAALDDINQALILEPNNAVAQSLHNTIAASQ